MADVGPSFWACGSRVSASPWLAQRSDLASAIEVAHRAAAATATIRAKNMKLPPAVVVKWTLTGGLSRINGVVRSPMGNRYRRRWFLVAALALMAATATAQDKVRLEVYSTLEIENLNDFKKAFEA